MEIKFENETKVSKEQEKFRKQEIKKVDAAGECPYTDQELEYRGELMRKIELSRWTRSSSWAEWNDMNYQNNYLTNKQAANSYNEPKKNLQDTRVVTGTTEEKEMTLMSAIMNYNLEPNVEAYDQKNMPVVRLGETLEDLIRKSRQLEDYDDKRPLVYKELLDQGSCFVEVGWVERFKIIKKTL